MKFNGQLGQDKLLYDRYYSLAKTGFFVDIGAYDGINLSNSCVFEELGWEGICSEPHPDRFAELTKNRKCVCHNAAVSDLDVDNVTFNKILGAEETEMLSGIPECYDKRHADRVKSECESANCSQELITVKNYKFNDIIPARQIDILFLDTEGTEQQILKSIDFMKYQINTIVFEDNFFEYKHETSFLNSIYDKINYGSGYEWDMILRRKYI